MERKEKIENGMFYHVYNRGNNRMQIYGDESDYYSFIEKMKSSADRYSVKVLAYTLMPNHYHIIAMQKEGGCLSNMMAAIATSAAKRYNLKYGHIGHLFQGPFRYLLVPEDLIYYVACYIHLNPVRAGLVRKPEEWQYSNFAELNKRIPASDKIPGERNPLFELGKMPPSTKKNLDKSNSLTELGKDYIDFVRQMLKEESMEKEYWEKVRSHVEGFLLQQNNNDEGNLQS